MALVPWLPFFLVACGGDGSPTDPNGNGNGPDLGSIQVTASTTNNLDPNGYEVTVDGSSVAMVEVNGSVTISDVSAGNHTVSLTGIAPNCALDGQAAQTVSVSKGNTTTATYSVTCTDPPGGIILFRRVLDGAFMISAMNADGSGMVDLLPGGDFPVFSPDGTLIAFSKWDGQGNLEVFVMNKDASGVTQLTSDSDAWAVLPSWSPDGTQIGYAVGGGIFVVGADGSGPIQVSSQPTHTSHGPSWSPDGSKIVFSSGEPYPSDHLIQVMNVDGSEMAPIQWTKPGCPMNTEWWHYDPVWSPNGGQILFWGASCDGPDDIFVMEPDGGNVRDLGRGTLPQWSPDGTQIIYIGGSPDPPGIYLMNADGTGKALLKGGEDLLYPSWGG
jgi:TolB protein